MNRRKQHELPCDIFRNEFLEFDEYKKETSTPLEQQLYGNKPISLYSETAEYKIAAVIRGRNNLALEITEQASDSFLKTLLGVLSNA